MNAKQVSAKRHQAKGDNEPDYRNTDRPVVRINIIWELFHFAIPRLGGHRRSALVAGVGMGQIGGISRHQATGAKRALDPTRDAMH
jgi:hypothetical protein